MRRVLLVAATLATVACSAAEAPPGGPVAVPPPVDPALGPAPRTPPEASYVGKSAGCGKLLAYRASEDATQFFTVSLDAERLGLRAGARAVFDLGREPDGVAVAVDVFASAQQDAYCTDRSSAAPMTTWMAEAGNVEVMVSADGRARIRADSVHLVGPERGLAIIVPKVIIADIDVGGS